jgi:hypothetical protein
VCAATPLSILQPDTGRLSPWMLTAFCTVGLTPATSTRPQVFYLISNDHITHRVLHVQLVSKIARTIGRFLRLNEDLIEAIALGHDIGHTPFGHEGERYLSELCQQAGIGYFSCTMSKASSSWIG